MKKTTTNILIVTCFFVTCLSLIGYVFWFNNFRPARITADEAYNVAKDYLSKNNLDYNITRIKQGSRGPNPFFYHTWNVDCYRGSSDWIIIEVDAFDGTIIDVVRPIYS